MSRHLDQRRLRAIEKVGDCMIPGDAELPRFSRTSCASQVDRILDHMPEQDLKDLKMLLGILALRDQQIFIEPLGELTGLRMTKENRPPQHRSDPAADLERRLDLAAALGSEQR